MLALLDALIARLEESLRAQDWEELSRSEVALRELVGQAMADTSLNAQDVARRVRQLQKIYQMAASNLEGAKSSATQEILSARKSFKAASSYLSNS